MHKKILLTAFEVFGSYKSNSSLDCINDFKSKISGIEIIKEILPVNFIKSTMLIEQLIEKYRPDVIILTGQFSVSRKICIERIAININDTIMPDNAGDVPVDKPIYYDGPAAYFSTLPIKKINRNILKNGAWSEISNSAGTYVCNNVMYSALHYIKKHNLSTPCGFIHIPLLGGANSLLTIEIVVDCFDIAIDTIIQG